MQSNILNFRAKLLKIWIFDFRLRPKIQKKAQISKFRLLDFWFFFAIFWVIWALNYQGRDQWYLYFALHMSYVSWDFFSAGVKIQSLCRWLRCNQPVIFSSQIGRQHDWKVTSIKTHDIIQGPQITVGQSQSQKLC